MNNCIINKKQIQGHKAPYHSIHPVQSAHWGVWLRAAWASAHICCASTEGRSTSFRSSVTTSKSSLTWEVWLKSCPCTEGSGLKARNTQVSIENVFNSLTDRHLANTNAFGPRLPQCVTKCDTQVPVSETIKDFWDGHLSVVGCSSVVGLNYLVLCTSPMLLFDLRVRVSHCFLELVEGALSQDN